VSPIPGDVLVRVQVSTATGLVAADLRAGGRVEVMRWGSSGWDRLGEGRFVHGEILGAPGHAVIEERSYAALEAGLDAFHAMSLG
jgi:hypothetical protein